uniref:Putative salivary secreted protein n=1 Tax=Ixodes ricinus TaxID=34613 RepID=A0A090XBW5_IXORI
MRTTRLIVGNCFVVCLRFGNQLSPTFAIKGNAKTWRRIATKKIQDLCKNHTAGKLEEVNVRPRECRATCILSYLVFLTSSIVCVL